MTPWTFLHAGGCTHSAGHHQSRTAAHARPAMGGDFLRPWLQDPLLQGPPSTDARGAVLVWRGGADSVRCGHDRHVQDRLTHGLACSRRQGANEAGLAPDGSKQPLHHAAAAGEPGDKGAEEAASASEQFAQPAAATGGHGYAAGAHGEGAAVGEKEAGVAGDADE